MKKGIMFLIVCLGLLFGCGDKSELHFKASLIHHDFPVPEYAKLVDAEATNPRIEQHARYEWDQAVEIESIPSDYFIKILECGWEEMKDEQLGARRVFTKDDTIIWLITHNGYFSLSTINYES